VENSRIRRLVQENLARFGIAHLAGRPARKISGGEAQRASLARALATEPQILFLDEPFSSLDPPSREALIEDLEKVLKSAGITAVMTTHDHGEARRLSNRMAVMGDGRILQIDDPAAVFHRPADPFVAAFVGVDNLIPALVTRSEGGRLWLDVAGCPIQAHASAAAGTGVTLCVRPESVRLLTTGSVHDDALANVFAGRIVKVIPMGHFYKIHLDCGFAVTALWTEPFHADAGWSVGDPATIHIPPQRIHLIIDPNPI
jgi:tungstate transport system ATP-binding protein